MRPENPNFVDVLTSLSDDQVRRWAAPAAFAGIELLSTVHVLILSSGTARPHVASGFKAGVSRLLQIVEKASLVWCNSMTCLVLIDVNRPSCCWLGYFAARKKTAQCNGHTVDSSCSRMLSVLAPTPFLTLRNHV